MLTFWTDAKILPNDKIWGEGCNSVNIMSSWLARGHGFKSQLHKRLAVEVDTTILARERQNGGLKA